MPRRDNRCPPNRLPTVMNKGLDAVRLSPVAFLASKYSHSTLARSSGRSG
ncbi:hypothetical protein [Chlorogloea sp. CCALA 695]|nr:hypothetical protein [Chlorogloea sp. CCALA 695]